MHLPHSATTDVVTVVRFTDDLRLTDNAALSWAAEKGQVVGLFVFENIPGLRPLGAAADWWCRRSLSDLGRRLRDRGVPLYIATGDACDATLALASRLRESHEHVAVTWNRRYHLPLREADARLKQQLRDAGFEAHSHPSHLLAEPWDVATRAGEPFKVFTPYANALQTRLSNTPPTVRSEPRLLGPPVDQLNLDGTGLQPVWDANVTAHEPRWAENTLDKHCMPGEDSAHTRFREFLKALEHGVSYKELSDVPADHATSSLSPHLRFGEISPAYVWSETALFADRHPFASADAWAFLRQLLWRDFAWHRLYYLPEMAEKNVRSQFDEFPWAWNANADPGASKSALANMDMEPDEDARQHLDELAAWQKGETGIPLVDAGMRELWATGTMHNRVRMVVGSWLTKNLGIHWRHGEEWFWDTLVDADYASNPFNWQWVAGSGDDAAPYFRIFNPLLQQEKFDPDGLYVNRWVPERHTPLYPEPMVDVKESRKTALAAYNDIRRGAKD